VLPLSYHFYRKALEKSFGSRVQFIYQDVGAPGDYPGAVAMATMIRTANLPLPVVAVNEEVLVAGRLLGVEELVREVKARLQGE